MTVPTPAVRLNKRGVTQMIQPKFLRRIRLAAVIAAVSIVTPANVSTPASAATPTVNWIKWTAPSSYSGGTYATTALGELTLPDGSTAYVKLDGEILSNSSASAFGTTSNTFWATAPFSGSGAAFKSANLPNLPTHGDRIGVLGTGVATQTLTFFSDSNRTIPVNVPNISMVIYSLGGAATQGQWDFDQEFTILSDNRSPRSIYGPLAKSTVGNKYRLSANEGTGALQFGSTNTIAWVISAPEFYASWNIGVTSEAVPAANIAASATAVTSTTGRTITDVTFTPMAFNGAVTYSVKSGKLPAGLTLNTATGKISGTPTETAEGVEVVIEGTDGTNTATSTVTFTITPPSFTVTFNTSGGSAIASTTTTEGGSLSDPGTPTRPGFVFSGWFTAQSGGTRVTFPYAHGQTSAFALYAQWANVATTTIPVATTTIPIATTTIPVVTKTALPEEASVLPKSGIDSVDMAALAAVLLLAGTSLGMLNARRRRRM